MISDCHEFNFHKVNKNSDASWDFVIEPHGSLFSLKLREVWQYRDLLRMYVKRDIVTYYKQTVLGPLWFFIQPAITTIMFMFVFGNIAGISTDGLPQPLFYMAGLLCWNYFADCLNRCSETFTANQNVFGKVYFPRLVVPLSITVSNLVKMGVQALLFLAIYLYYMVSGYGCAINAYALLLPVLIFMLAGLGLGFGMLISSVTTKYRDLKFLISFGVQLWMYATPVIYPLSTLKENHPDLMWIILINPMTSIIETFKFAFLGSGTFSWVYLGYSLAFTVIIMLLGILTFNKVERNFIDVV
ncbi:MAG: ABC transporter permease [Bacteroidales bacterium]|nr:ABC transporter permease [Candidatus Minthousia equi]